MKIQLTDHFSIEGDLNSYTLRYEKTVFDEVKQKEVISRDQWYYSNLRHCLEAFAEKNLVGTKDTTDIINRLEETINLIKNLK